MIKSPLISQIKTKFQNTLKPICNCVTFKATIRYLLHFPNFSNGRLTLFNKLQIVDENILSKDDSNISKGLLFSELLFNDVQIILFNCFNEIYSFNKTFWCSLFPCIHFILSLHQEITHSSVLFSFVISMLMIAYFKLFCKIIYNFSFFFSNFFLQQFGFAYFI